LIGAASAAAAAESKTVLFLQQAGPEKEAMAHFLAGFRDELAVRWPAPVALMTEDITAGLGGAQKLDDWLLNKYRGRRIDLIVAVEGPGTRLGVSVRDTLRPDAPVVVTGIGAQHYRGVAAHPNVTGVVIDHEVVSMLEAARRLCPDSKHLVFIPGGIKTTEEERKLWREDAEQFAAAAGMSFVDLTLPLPLADLMQRVSTMPPHSIVLRRDTIVGGLRRPSDLATSVSKLSQAANGPLFSLADAYAVDGSVGTGTVDYHRLGTETAAQVSSVLAAGSAASVPAVKSDAFTLTFDWRQLDRWGLDPDSLPQGSHLRFHQPGLWEAHRGKMIGLTAALAAQALLIAALLLQRHRRHRAEEQLRQQRAQLSHTLRLATMNQMASSLAHELNQPLTAIVNNAGAARRLMARGIADTSQIGEILADISQDGHRAGEVIRGIRGLVRRDEGHHGLIHPNDLVATVSRLVAAEVTARNCALTEDLAPAVPPVAGNAVQLQQVLLNLVMNAFEAADLPGASARRVIVSTEVEGDRTVRIGVRDFGPGLPPNGAQPLFEPFHTTKPDGMGMGLAIVRTIVEAHGGTIGASTMDDGGACFFLRLPAAALAQP
jgi:signal transduction histidine kinase